MKILFNHARILLPDRVLKGYAVVDGRHIQRVEAGDPLVGSPLTGRSTSGRLTFVPDLWSCTAMEEAAATLWMAHCPLLRSPARRI